MLRTVRCRSKGFNFLHMFALCRSLSGFQSHFQNWLQDIPWRLLNPWEILSVFSVSSISVMREFLDAVKALQMLYLIFSNMQAEERFLILESRETKNNKVHDLFLSSFLSHQVRVDLDDAGCAFVRSYTASCPKPRLAFGRNHMTSEFAKWAWRYSIFSSLLSLLQKLSHNSKISIFASNFISSESFLSPLHVCGVLLHFYTYIYIYFSTDKSIFKKGTSITRVSKRRRLGLYVLFALYSSNLSTQILGNRLHGRALLLCSNRCIEFCRCTSSLQIDTWIL